MNIPNSLTILRILLIPVYVGLLVYERFDAAMGVLLLAGVTDALDGTIARAANQRTRLGAFLDPLADKLLLTSGFITLSTIHLIPSWVTILVVSRDAMLLLGTAAVYRVEHRHCSNVFRERGDFSPTGLRAARHFSQLPSDGSVLPQPSASRNGGIYGVIGLSLSVSWISVSRVLPVLSAHPSPVASASA
jgi:phosphatidylglycerophosphate synthase